MRRRDPPFDVGCTCGTKENRAPLPASSKKAKPVMSPTKVAFDFGFRKPVTSRKTPVMVPQAWMRIFLPQRERVWR